MSPGRKQAWPTAAACWSPATPSTGRRRPSTAASVSPKSAAQSRISGSREAGTPNTSSIRSSHALVVRPQRLVRAALVASVACTRPPVNRQIRKLSTVPKASSPRAARSRAPSTRSRIQAILVAEKYGSSSRPVRSVTRSSIPSSRSRAQTPAVRLSCQTMALWIALPVRRSQTIVVSRWFVMPIATIARPAASAPSIASRVTARVVAQISSGSCSTQPLAG